MFKFTPPPPLLRLADSHTPDLRAVSSRSVNLLRLTATALSLTLLVACGGGGGGSGGAPAVMLESLPDPLVTNPDQARQHLNAVSPATPPAVPPPSLSSAQIERTINAIVSDADTFLYEVVGADVTCSGTSCTYEDSDGSEIEVTVDSFSTEDAAARPPGYNGQNTAVMTHNGITIGQRLIAARGTIYGEAALFEFQIYGGWGENNHFAVQRLTTIIGNDRMPEVNSYSFGEATGTRPTTGTGRWRGTMVGSHTQMNYLVQGSANIRINDFNENRLTILSLFNIKRLDTGADVNNLDWTAVPINMDGTFGKDGEVKGTFYGANHEEIGGTFNKNNIIGAFGGTRTGQ